MNPDRRPRRTTACRGRPPPSWTERGRLLPSHRPCRWSARSPSGRLDADPSTMLDLTHHRWPRPLGGVPIHQAASARRQWSWSGNDGAGHGAVARSSPTGDERDLPRMTCLTYGRDTDGTSDAVRQADVTLTDLAAGLGLSVACERLDFTARKSGHVEMCARQARLPSNFAYPFTLVRRLGATRRTCSRWVAS